MITIFGFKITKISEYEMFKMLLKSKSAALGDVENVVVGEILNKI